MLQLNLLDHALRPTVEDGCRWMGCGVEQDEGVGDRPVPAVALEAPHAESVGVLTGLEGRIPCCAHFDAARGIGFE
jgi:hypothetical protein